MRYIFPAFLCVMIVGLNSLGAQAVTPPQVPFDSVEWSCAASAHVVVGHITEVIDSSGGGKSHQLRSLFVRGVDLRAGAAAIVGSYPVSMRKVPMAQLEAWRKDKVLLVFFLRSTAQGYSFRGHSFHLWPTRDRANRQRVVSLKKPGRDLVSAAQKRLVVGEKDFRKVCLAALHGTKRPPKTALKPALWKVPAESPLYRALGCKGLCELVVPE